MELSTQLINRKYSIKKSCLSHKRLILPVLILVLLLIDSTSLLTINVLADAFWQVAAYVAVSLTLYHYAASFFSRYQWLINVQNTQNKYQVVFASVMGAMPGCGGAIIVITQFVQGKFSFGSVVAVLTATMGDAAFLLLAAQPNIGLLVIVIGVVVGIVSGVFVDYIHGNQFMRDEKLSQQDFHCHANEAKPQYAKYIKWQGRLWQCLLLPAVVIALLFSFQFDVDKIFYLPAGTINIIGAGIILVAIFLWACSGEVTNYQTTVSEDSKINTRNLFQKVAQDTHFVASWVIAAFLLFELLIHFTGVDLALFFSKWGSLTPLIAIIVGLLPGCGPQILMTSSYLSGAIPLSAQLGNAISNDGDALFPAIALAPKMAIVATLYSAIPAFIVAYGYWYIFEL